MRRAGFCSTPGGHAVTRSSRAIGAFTFDYPLTTKRKWKGLPTGIPDRFGSNPSARLRPVVAGDVGRDQGLELAFGALETIADVVLRDVDHRGNLRVAPALDPAQVQNPIIGVRHPGAQHRQHAADELPVFFPLASGRGIVVTAGDHRRRIGKVAAGMPGPATEEADHLATNEREQPRREAAPSRIVVKPGQFGDQQAIAVGGGLGGAFCVRSRPGQ